MRFKRGKFGEYRIKKWFALFPITLPLVDDRRETRWLEFVYTAEKYDEERYLEILEGKPNDCTFKETWLLDNGQQYEIAYSYTDINNHRDRKIRNELMEIHNAAPLYKTKVVYPEPAYFFLMKEIQKRIKEEYKWS